MDEVTVNKARLLETLKANREIHNKDFEIAWDAFRTQAIENYTAIVDSLKDAKRGATIKLNVNLVQPSNHSADYDTAIEMIDWEIGDEVSIEKHEFQNFVQDNWGWSREFTTANVMYTGSASPSRGA